MKPALAIAVCYRFRIEEQLDDISAIHALRKKPMTVLGNNIFTESVIPITLVWLINLQ
jgi:hypothetical protein